MSNEPRQITALGRRIGRRIRARRLAIGMSQERLAELIGVTFQQVQKYEKGVNRIAADKLHQVGEALGLPVGVFFVEAGDEAAVIAAEDEALALAAAPERVWATLAGVQIARALAGMTPAQQREVATIVESVARVAHPK